jgi:hypothetical protein
MKQASTPVLPPQIVSATAKEITATERESILNLSTKDGPMKMKEKKTFLLQVLSLKSDLIQKATLFDEVSGASQLAEELKLILPASKKQINDTMKKNELSEKIVSLSCGFEVLLTYITGQYEIEAQSRNFTRRSAKAVKKDAVLALLEDYKELMIKVDEMVITKRTKDLYKAFSSVSLTPQQRSRRFSTDRVPVDPGLQMCVMCKHPSTNSPIENDEVLEYNKRKVDEFVKEVDKFDREQANNAKNGVKSTKRRPTQPKKKLMIVQCMCAMSSCVAQRNGIANNCPIKCMKKTTNENNEEVEERHPYIGTPYPKCSCPLCACKCNFACYTKDVPHLLAATREIPSAENGKANAPAGGVLQVDAATRGTAMFANVIRDTLLTGMAEFRKDHARQEQEKKAGSKKKYRLEPQYYENMVTENIATNLLKAGGSFSINDRHLFLEQMGRTSTQDEEDDRTTVVLPSGSKFDTRTIGQSGQHSRNNKLGTNPEKQIQPGMTSNLNIDFDVPVSAKFEAYATSFQNQSYLSLFQSMYERTLKRGRSNVTATINDRRVNGDSEEKRKKCKKMWNSISQLESAEKEEKHLSIIKSVTDDGKLLTGSNPMSSQDVFANVSLLFDDEV